ncbi:MAG: fibronectin type III domain-containing protein [Ectothiorhodospiraceae bacterium]|jgi:hypothetical protein
MNRALHSIIATTLLVGLAMGLQGCGGAAGTNTSSADSGVADSGSGSTSSGDTSNSGGTTNSGGDTSGGTTADSGGSTSGGNTADSVNTSVTLSWVAPTERENGDALSMSEIGGYRVYYGTASGDYSSEVAIKDPYATQYTVDGLDAGSDYYFAVAAYDQAGLQSSLSQEVTVTVQ